MPKWTDDPHRAARTLAETLEPGQPAYQPAAPCPDCDGEGGDLRPCTMTYCRYEHWWRCGRCDGFGTIADG